MLATSLAFALAMTPAPTDYKARAADWRNGAVVYQIFVDRFVPSANLDAKRGEYAAPRKLMKWSDTPKPGTRDDKAGVYSHELEFWGGDLASAQTKLGYVADLGVDVVSSIRFSPR